MPATLVMFALSKRIGRLADRVGPRFFMGFGPLTAALGLALMLRIDADLDYFTDLLPALLVFSLGLAFTVAPLTAAVLSDADESNAGIASGVNNAIARIAGLLAVAAIGAVVAGQFNSSLDDSPYVEQSLPGCTGRGRSGSQSDVRERRSGGRRPGGGAGRPVRLGACLPRRPGHLGGARGARRPARPGRNPQSAARRALPGLPGRPAGRPAARRGSLPPAARRAPRGRRAARRAEPIAKAVNAG